MFGRLPSLSQSQKQALTDGGDLTSILGDENLQNELQEALGPIYESYMANLDTVILMLERLIVKDKGLKLDPMAGQGYLRAAFDDASLIKWTKEDVVKRIRFSRREKRRIELLTEIESCNRKLQEFYIRSQDTTSVIDLWQKRPGNPLIHVVEHARCLYTVLQTCWQCQCCAAHETLLRLEQRQMPKPPNAMEFSLLFSSKTPSNSDIGGSSWKQMNVRFVAKGENSSLVKKHPKVRWEVLESSTRRVAAVNPVDSGSKTDGVDYTALRDVPTICETISHEPTTTVCFGLVIDEERKLKGPYNTEKWHSSLSSEVTTLNLLLQRSAQIPSQADPMDSTTLFKLERMTLAVNLASSLLQLHGTPWVNERWNKHDIIFFTTQAGVNSESRRRPADIERPLLNQRFSASGTKMGNTYPELPPPIHPNLGVLSLGIMLSELWFATPIEARRLESDLVDGQPNSSTDLAVAERWVKENANLDDMPAGYWQAVKSCIYCFFDPMPRNKSLENPDFRDAVWQNVVMPLERELHA